MSEQPPIDVSMTVPQYIRGECTIHRNGMRVRVSLQPQMADILFMLMVNRGAPIHINRMIEFLWPNPDDEPEYPVILIRSRMCDLKKVLPGIIYTHWTIGYELMLPGVQHRK